MKHFFYLLVFLLPLWQTALAQPKTTKKQFHLFLLAGQSNMAGRGKVETEDKTPHPRVWVLTKNNEWQLATEPLHFDKPNAVGVGPGLAFAKALANLDTNVIIGLIPCSVGGSPIDAWQPTKYYEPTKSYPYDDALKRTKTAMQTGTLKGVLWHQGESDSDSVRAKIHNKQMVLLIEKFRKDLKMKYLPFVAGTLAEFYTAKNVFAKNVNEGIEALPSQLKNVTVVRASGLAHKGDGTHFDSPSARELGKRYAMSFIQTKPISTEAIATLAMEKGLKEVDLAVYGGTLFMHGMSELAVLQKDPKTLNRTIEIFEKFKSKEIKGHGSFISCEAGGTGVAYLNYLNKTPNLSAHVFEYAHKMFKNQKRTSEGLMTAPWLKDSLDQVMIDCAFAVTPYMLYAGLSMNKSEYVDLAVFQTLEMFKILKDPNGLIHQGRGFAGLGSISEDNWSRGNGWGAFALAFLVRDLPGSHPKKKEVNELAKNFFMAILKYQNQEGLWNQEMTEHSSFVETSGSGLMLFGLGICIEKGIIDRVFLPQFIKGLSGYTSYITPDGSISNVTIGCLCPGKGTKKDYIKHAWKRNDIHAFGPVVLAFTQAMKLGIREITPAKSMGCYVTDFGKTIKPLTKLEF